jgi:N-acetyl-anhydromuramyl-L-alanine amidase AmpD
MDIGREEIEAWHLERGFDAVGYHFIIRRDGTIEEGRPLDVMGAHAKGFNAESLGVCLVGNNRFDATQYESLQALYRMFRARFGFDHSVWDGHYELDNKKTCPNLPMTLVRAYLLETYRADIRRG